ncbi:imelysin family protein [Zavarzinia sp. CC-PAN008]|uniref:imelysin family protein n=1 Tax=Zavarzinia sp. CC-PAN008 TaxID=3243332 RepID=UPI003F74863E
MRILRNTVAAVALLAATPALAADPAAVIATYGDVAHAMYADSLVTAEALDKAVDALIANPTDETLKAARAAWLAARVPYQQTEGFRFGNALVDDWEGRVNAWPLDEGLIDYVAPAYGTESDSNPLYAANIIANTSLRIGPETLDTTTIDKPLIKVLHEAQEVEANVTTGYHAIEFLLWGQDLNGTGPGAGNRPATDYSTTNCTGGNCDRRAAYLKAASSLLVDDLREMVGNWEKDGPARQALTEGGPDKGLATILTGLGSLSYGELAGERMKLGLILHDPEEEHDCFSDNTHNSHYYDQVGMWAIYTGSYTRIDGSKVEGPGINALIAAKDKAAGEKIDAAFTAATAALKAIKDEADSGRQAYDQMIGPDNAAGNALVQAGVDGLVAQARAIEGGVAALGLTISVEGSDSLDNPSAVGAE